MERGAVEQSRLSYQSASNFPQGSGSTSRTSVKKPGSVAYPCNTSTRHAEMVDPRGSPVASLTYLAGSRPIKDPCHSIKDI